MTATQRSRISFLTLVVLGTLGVPLLAYSAGAAVFTTTPAEDAHLARTLVDAPPPIVLVALGLLMISAAVARRNRKMAAQRAINS